MDARSIIALTQVSVSLQFLGLLPRIEHHVGIAEAILVQAFASITDLSQEIIEN